MASMQREDRERRIDRDDGDLDDEVVVGRNGQRVLGYHDDPSCKNAPKEGRRRTVTRREAQKMSRFPCACCVLDDDGGMTHNIRGDQCQAENQHGEQCRKGAILDGYCNIHLDQAGGLDV